MDDTTMDDTTMDDTSTTQAPATLSGTGLEHDPEATSDANGNNVIRIAGGANYSTPNGGSIACTGATACIVTVSAHGNAPIVTVTEGTATFTATQVAGGDGQRTGGDTHPLSHENLLAAVITTEGDRGTLYGAPISDATLTLLSGNGAIFQRGDGYNTRLVLSETGPDDVTDESDYVYFGHWAEWERGTDEQKAKRNVVWGGSTPYGKIPPNPSQVGENAVRSASYGGGDDGTTPNAEVSYKVGSGNWIPVNAVVQLTAHFDTRKILGTVSGTSGGTGAEDIVTGSVHAIRLGSTDITASGFSGKAEFASGKTTTGSWEGAFYGDSDAPAGVGEEPSAAPAPSFAAGEFGVKGTNTATTPASVDIRGAFGAELDDGA